MEAFLTLRMFTGDWRYR